MVYFTVEYKRDNIYFDELVALADKFLAHNNGEYIYNDETGLTLTKLTKDPSIYVLTHDDGGDELLTSSIYQAMNYLMTRREE